MSVQFDTSEVSNLAADLGRAGADAERASSQALSKVAAKLRDDIVDAAPVLTGETKASVKLSGGKGSRTINVGGASFFLEFGTSKMPPQPFVFNRVPTANTVLAGLLADISPLDP